MEIQEAVNARVNRRIRRRRTVALGVVLLVVSAIGLAATKIPWETIVTLMPWPSRGTAETPQRTPWPPPGNRVRSTVGPAMQPQKPAPAPTGSSGAHAAVGGTALEPVAVMASPAAGLLPRAAGRKTDANALPAEVEPLWLKKRLQGARSRSEPGSTTRTASVKPKESDRPTIPSSEAPVTSQLQLQALAWSEDMVRRMAVINDLVVHEGDWVAGFQVVSILPEKVVVDDGRRRFRLEFSH